MLGFAVRPEARRQGNNTRYPVAMTSWIRQKSKKLQVLFIVGFRA